MFLPRKIYKEVENHLKQKQVTVITGMRRSGKTSIVRQLLLEVKSTNKAYLDLEQASLREIFKEKNYDNILLDLSKKFDLKLEEKIYIAIDEIQHAPELPSVIKYLYDHHDIKFIVTGSSSYYMKNLFTESLAGRKKIFELYPLDFGEFLDFKKIYHKDASLEDMTFGNFEYENFKKFYDEYIEFGGFPEVVLSPDIIQKKDLLNDIISSYISIDVQSLSDFKKKEDFYSIIKMLAGRTGTRIDYAKLSKMVGISAITLRNYIGFFEDTYLIHRVSVFTKNTDIEIVKAKKLYFIDNGLVNVLSDISSGVKFENAVFNQLRHKGGIKYYSMKDGREIDFILDDEIALEVKETPTNSDLNNLRKLAESLSIVKYMLVGKNNSPKFDKYIWGGSIR
jgi:predicted AAA+ superfamily ATPase